MVGSWNSEDMVEAEIEQESESECATWGTENGMMKIQRVLLGMSEDHVFKGEIAMMARDELNKTDGDTKEDSGEGANKIMEDTNGEMEAKINGVWLENGGYARIDEGVRNGTEGNGSALHTEGS